MAFRLAHFSDIHLTAPANAIPWRDLFSKRLLGWLNLRLLGRGRTLIDAEEVTRACVEDILHERPDHVLFTGDATGLSLPVEFEAAQRVLAPLVASGQVTGIPGNHDVYVRSAVKRGLYERHLGAWEESDLPDAPPLVRFLGQALALVVVKDSRVRRFYDSSGEVGAEQLERLERVLSLAEVRRRRRILALHYGPLRTDGRPDGLLHRLRDIDALLDVARRGEVDVLVHGHLHRRSVFPAGGALPVATANPGSLTLSTLDRAYHVYHVEPGEIRLEVRRYSEPERRFVPWPDAPGTGRLWPPSPR
jgi:3',5'-cyclic AMP phosphodiesterase CpdA